MRTNDTRSQAAVGWDNAAREAARASHQHWIVASMRPAIERGPFVWEKPAEYAKRLSELLARETAVADGVFPEAAEFYAAARSEVAA